MREIHHRGRDRGGKDSFNGAGKVGKKIAPKSGRSILPDLEGRLI